MNPVYSTKSFEDAYTYHGNDLGAVWTPSATAFRVWAPTAKSVSVCLYASGTNGTDDMILKVPMSEDVNGTWTAQAEGDLNGVYYTYLVDVEGKTVEACDPYARAAGVNGKRAMVLDLASTNPDGWERDIVPHPNMSLTDAVIYELHVRDLSADLHSGIKNRGKFLGVIETGTTTQSGISTGLDHMKQLGITHLHLLPVYDYGSVDEASDKPQFNWGYDPVNFNVPEGSYSTDPFHGQVRVAEMKQMIKGLHDSGIGVVMDVVYNHVYQAEQFCFNQIVPYYFSRFDEQGKLVNASCCGNDTASERSMVHKYIVDSVNYWADEYHIDGFRFDLVGLIDTDTINDIMTTVHRKHPHVIFYGEGWDMARGVTKPGMTMTTQHNADKVPGFAFFNDYIRDILRGSVFDYHAKGFLSGEPIDAARLTACFIGRPGWTKDPAQVINYISCHDNHTLYDRIQVALPKASRLELVQWNNLGAAFCLLSQGVPFFQAGEEMLRSKPTRSGEPEHNSYKSSDRVNSLKWEHLNEDAVLDTVRYYQGLLAIRKAYSAFRLRSEQEIEKAITVLPAPNPRTVVFCISAHGQKLVLIYNAANKEAAVDLPDGTWNVLACGKKAGTKSLGTAESQASVPPISAMILVQNQQ